MLCGRLITGDAKVEKDGFAGHPGLLAHCRPGNPPILFHKATLQEAEDSSLAAEVREAIGSSQRRVVGVIINAVDDHLLKGEQIDTRWTRDEIKVLPSLLHEAMLARRIVVFVSDHGHVLDHRAVGKAYEGGERWRFDDEKPSDQELRIAGSRVVIPDSHKLIAPWTEKLRYGVKKNGYHGGLTPQEMIIPITVLAAHDTTLDGWVEAPVGTPVWWDEAIVERRTTDTSGSRGNPGRQERRKTRTSFRIRASATTGRNSRTTPVDRNTRLDNGSAWFTHSCVPEEASRESSP